MPLAILEIGAADDSVRTAAPQNKASSHAADGLQKTPMCVTYKGEKFLRIDKQQLSAMLDEPHFGGWAREAAVAYNATPGEVLFALAVALQADLGR